MDQLTIFHINTERSFRGGEVQTILLAKQLQRNGHQNLVFAQKESLLAQKAREAGLRTVELSMRGEWDIYAARKIRRAIHDSSPSILHAHTPHACALAILARGRTAKPAIVFSRRISSPLNRTTKYKRVDGLIAVSPEIQRQLMEAGFPDDRVFLAESATDFSQIDQHDPREQIRESLGIPREAFVIGNVGHFDRHKGQASLIEAFSRLGHERRFYFLMLVGSGPKLSECRSLAQSKPIRDRILFTGQRFDLGNIYAAMDAFFLPSSPAAFEGWSGVLREAMGAGLPVIAVQLSATEDQIRHQEMGILVSANAMEEWTNAIEHISSNPEQARRMADNGKKFARQFTTERLAQKTERCYRETLRKLRG